MSKYNFSYKVNLDDLDYAGHVGNADWLIFLERARIELLNEINFSILEMKKISIFGVVGESKLKYLKPSTYGDTLDILIEVKENNSKSVLLDYSVHNQGNQKCLDAQIVIVFVGKDGKVVDIPKKIVDII